jgi:hypothetical protein
VMSSTAVRPRTASCCIDTSDGLLAALDELARVNRACFTVAEDPAGFLHPAALKECRRRDLPAWLALVPDEPPPDRRCHPLAAVPHFQNDRPHSGGLHRPDRRGRISNPRPRRARLLRRPSPTGTCRASRCSCRRLPGR